MEIKSIKKISRVGVFCNCQEGSKRFEKLTILYGFNTHGKSTLCDILNSLSKNDSTIVESRATIPRTNSTQFVEISYQDEGNERSVYFRNGAWEPNTLGSRIEVFGTDFIHNNVFTGLGIERSNKENFTDFILGERGVSLASRLAQTNHELKVATIAYGKSAPGYVSGRSTDEIENFIDLAVNEPLETLVNNIQLKTAELVAEKDNLKNIAEILNMAVPKAILDCKLKNILVLFRYANYCLRLSYERIDNLIMERLQQHILRNFLDTNSAESWIQKGLTIGKINDNSNCPFCGKQLTDALDLIRCYRAYFNDKYRAFITGVNAALEKAVFILEKVDIDLVRVLSDNLLAINEYRLLITNEKFKSLVRSLDELRINLARVETKLRESLEEAIKNLKTQTDVKKRAHHQSIDHVDTTNLKKLISECIGKYSNAQSINSEIIALIDEFKNQFSADRITVNIAVIQSKLDDLNRQRSRLEQDKQCIRYRQLKSSIVRLKNEVDALSKELEDSQSEYIDKYFLHINNLFRELGSNEFQLEKVIDPRGNKKVYSLSVKFKGYRITNNLLPFVFSESDRRALALSIFWTKLLITNDRSKTIVILDDPAASFDDNRITKTINLFKSAIDELGQIVILTHYPNFVARFLEITKDKQVPFKIFELHKMYDNCEFREVTRQDFQSNSHEKRFLKIYNFINRKNNIDVRSELRPYLESYLKMIFFKQILDYSIDTNNLEHFIDALEREKIINNVQSRELHKYRTTLNPDSHILTCNNIEDLRNFSEEMFTFLHRLSFSTI